jgi:hypothetical protein
MVNKINGGGTSEWDVYNDYAGKNSTENRLATNASYTSNRLSSLATPSVVFVPDAVAANQSSVNLARSTFMEGAVVGVLGSGGSLPTGWTSSGGGTITVVATGVLGDIPYIDIRIQNPTSFLNIRPGPTTSNIAFGAAAAGDIFTFSWYQMLVAGDYASGANWQIYGISSTNQQVLFPNLSNNLLRLWTDASPVRAISPELGKGWGHRYKFTTGPVSDPTPDTVTGCGVRWGHAAGAFDYTVRFGGIQFEKGEGTPLILSGSLATAGDGKIMLQKPLLFGMNVTNNDKGTLINRNGLIEPNVYNLAIRSQELQYAPTWTLTNATVTTNNEIAPDGTLTADTLTATSGGGQIQQVVTGEASTAYTVSIYLRRRTGAGTVNIRCVENVNTPVAVTSEWQRFSLTVTSTTTSIRIGVNLATSGDAVDVWGAQVEVGTLLRAYQRTSNVLGNKLRIEYTTVEPAATNLCLRSEEFDNSPWLKVSSSTVSSNVAFAPNGSYTADKHITSTTNGQQQLNQTIACENDVYTFSVYLKKGEYDYGSLRIGSGGAVFNLVNGTIFSTTAGINSSIVPAIDGWYRCIISLQSPTGSIGNVTFRINMSQNGIIAPSFAGDGVSGMFVWGAQVERGAVATAYIPTTTAAVTRDAVVGAPAALIEPAATNLAWHSQTWATGTNWGLISTTTVTGTTGTLDPLGTNTANAISPTSASGAHLVLSNNPTAVSYTSGTIYTQSAFFKQGTGAAGRYVQLTFTGAAFTQAGYANFDLQTGALVASGGTADTNRAASIENYGNGWYRCRFTATCNTTSTGVGVIPVLITASGDTRTPSFTGVTSDILYGWGAQVETGAVATSYIPTTTASATRAAEVCSVSGVSGYIGQTEGTIYWDIAAVGGVLTGTGNPEFGVRNEAFTNWIGLTSNNPSLPFRITAQATVGNLINYQANITSGKAALAWSSAGLVLYVNGISVATSATNPNFSFSRADIRGVTMAFKANAFAIYKTRLPNDVLAVMTNPVDYATFEEMTWAQFVAKSSTYTELPACLETRHNQIIIV